ncbi:MAG: 6-phosphogluconolactonase [Chlorobi bacterium]|nr:6-phosphogluconolactonase [Chlorobiota bacterium]
MTTSLPFITGNEAEVTGHAAALIISEAWRAVSRRGRFTFVLSGGRSPRPLYRKLASGVSLELMRLHDLPCTENPEEDDLIHMPWKKTLIFWGDERCVPPSHPESNYRLAKETLLDAPGIEEARVFRIPGELYPHHKAAESYEETIRKVFGCRDDKKSPEIPAFDLMVLGLGEDGHTASLFPEDRKNLEETRRLVVAVETPHGQPRIPRLSITLPLINRARTVLFFTEGKKRAELAKKIRSGTASAVLPAGMVKPASGNLFWFTVLP